MKSIFVLLIFLFHNLCTVFAETEPSRIKAKQRHFIYTYIFYIFFVILFLILRARADNNSSTSQFRKFDRPKPPTSSSGRRRPRSTVVWRERRTSARRREAASRLRPSPASPRSTEEPKLGISSLAI